MMKHKLIIIVSLIAVCPVLTQAQALDEFVLQLSQSYPGGTSRMLGLGGSKVALGGDAGNIFVNPAGLGFYNSSQFTFSPSLNNIASSTDFLNQNVNDNKLNFNLAHIGAVFNRSKGVHNESKWRGGSFAFSFNRINSFHYDITYQGENAQEDIIDYGVEQSNFFGATDITDLLEATGVIDEFYTIYEGQDLININGFSYDVFDVYGSNLNEGDSLFFNDRDIYDSETGELAFPTEDFPVLQREEIESRGSQYAASLSYGGNYNDKLYFGFGLNILTIERNISRRYSEVRNRSDLSELIFTDEYSLIGTGVNGTFGLIVRPATPILIGFSYTTPTIYGLEEIRDLSMVTDFQNVAPFSETFSYQPYFYSLTMPSEIRGGLTYFFGKNGFISADIASSNINNAQFSNGDGGYEFGVENEINRETFDQRLQVGIGGEYRMGMWRLRGGYNYTSDPTNAQGIDFDRSIYSAGVGMRKRNYFIDLAYNYLTSTQLNSPYPTEIAVAESTLNTHMTTLTLGFTF